MSRLEEIKEILLESIGNHQSLDHKLHLMEDVKNVFKQAERVEELEEELNRERKRNTKVAFKNLKYKQALEEIAQDTGTPYANIAIKALAGDTE